MRKTLACLMVLAGLSLAAQASTPKGFTDDFDAALASAKVSGKTVYAVFSGSDWCYWCQVLEKGYLSKKEFVDEAAKNFVLVFVDTPRDKAKLSEKARARNPELTRKYGIRGFPTVLFVDAAGEARRAPRPGQEMTPQAYARELARAAKAK